MRRLCDLLHHMALIPPWGEWIRLAIDSRAPLRLRHPPQGFRVHQLIVRLDRGRTPQRPACGVRPITVHSATTVAKRVTSTVTASTANLVSVAFTLMLGARVTVSVPATSKRTLRASKLLALVNAPNHDHHHLAAPRHLAFPRHLMLLSEAGHRVPTGETRNRGSWG